MYFLNFTSKTDLSIGKISKRCWWYRPILRCECRCTVPSIAIIIISRKFSNFPIEYYFAYDLNRHTSAWATSTCRFRFCQPIHNFHNFSNDLNFFKKKLIYQSDSTVTIDAKTDIGVQRLAIRIAKRHLNIQYLKHKQREISRKKYLKKLTLWNASTGGGNLPQSANLKFHAISFSGIVNLKVSRKIIIIIINIICFLFQIAKKKKKKNHLQSISFHFVENFLFTLCLKKKWEFNFWKRTE